VAMFDFSAIKNALKNVGDEHQKLLTKLEKLKRERDEVAASPIPKNELKEKIVGLLDSVSNNYPKQLLNDFRHQVVGEPMTHPEIRIGNILRNGTGNSVSANTLLYLLRDQIAEGIKRAVDEMPYPGPEGLPTAEREAKLADLDKQIEKAETELQKLTSQAQAAGVELKGFRVPAKGDRA